MKALDLVCAGLLLMVACQSGEGLVSISLDSGVTITESDAGSTIITVPNPIPDAGPDAGPPNVACSPIGATQACYTGPAGSLDAGCSEGTSTCLTSGYWGPCANEIVPTPVLTDVIIIMDDTDETCIAGMVVSEFIETQQTATQVIYDNLSPLYRWGIIDMPGCTPNWPQTYSLVDSHHAIENTSLQCVISDIDYPACASTPVDPYNTVTTQINGTPITWDDGAKKIIIMFSSMQPTPTQISSILNAIPGVTVVQFRPNPQSCAGCGIEYPLSDYVTMTQQIDSILASTASCN